MRRMLILAMLSPSLLSLPVSLTNSTLKNGDRLSGTIVKSDDDAKTTPDQKLTWPGPSPSSGTHNRHCVFAASARHAF